jgi:hypothetical protein
LSVFGSQYSVFGIRNQWLNHLFCFSEQNLSALAIIEFNIRPIDVYRSRCSVVGIR